MLDHIRRVVSPRAAGGATDGQLLEAFATSGDETAFNLLVRRHGPLVWAVCRRVLHDAHDAEDAFQATFLVLARRAGSIRKQSSVGSWLHGVAYRMSLQARRHRSTLRRHERPNSVTSADAAIDPPGPAPDPGEEVTLREALTILDEEVSRLPVKLQAPVVLCYFEGLTNDEAAAELGCAGGTLRSRLLRARELLSVRLNRRGVIAPAGALAVLSLPAAVPAPLARAAVVGALSFVGRGAGAISREVLRLANRAVRTMMMRRISWLAAGLLGLGLLGAGVGVFVHQVTAQVRPGEPAAPADPGAAPRPAAKADGHGDALPPGALARLGTVRGRHGSRLGAVAFAAGGKEVVTAGPDGLVRVWEAAAGKELRRLGDGKPDPEPDPYRGRPTALAADGSNAATTDGAGTVHVWAVATGKELRSFASAKKDSVWAVALAPDGKALLISAEGFKATLRDLATGKERCALEVKEAGAAPAVPERPGGLGHIAVSADGRYVAAPFFEQPQVRPPGATANFLAGVRLWDATTGKVARHFGEWTSELAGLPPMSCPPAFAPDGKTIARVALDGTVRLHDTANGNELRTLGEAGKMPPVAGLAFAPDGKRVAVSLRDRTARLYDAATGKELRALGERIPTRQLGPLDLPADFDTVDLTLEGPPASFSPDGKTLALASGRNALRLWDVDSGKARPWADGHSGAVEEIGLAPDGKTALTRASDATFRRWNLATGKELGRVELPAGATVMSLSASGRFVAFIPNDKMVVLWDAAAGKEARKIELPAPGPGADPLAVPGAYIAGLSPDDKVLATVEAPRVVRLWEAATGKRLRDLAEDPAEPVEVRHYLLGLQFSRDGRSLLTAAALDPAPVPGVPAPLPGGGFKPVDPKTVLRVWDTATGKTLRRWEAPGSVTSAVFTPDGRSLATATPEGITVWEVATGKERQRYKLPEAILACSPKGRVLAAAVGPEVVLLDLAADKELGRLRGHAAEVRSLAFTADGKALVTGSADSTALVWGVEAAWERPGK
jgi:RNA polymerase sigma factor (sigma-70 family)